MAGLEVRPLLPTSSTPADAKRSLSRCFERLRIPPRLLGIVLVAASAFTFSLLSTCIKIASASMPAMETVFWRSIVAWAFNRIAIRVYDVDLRVPKRFWQPLASRCLVGTCAMSLGFYAMQQMVLADASVLLFTSPILTFLLSAAVLSERIDRVHFTYALLSFIGVICVARPSFLFGVDSNTAKRGSAIAVACALLGAVARSVVYVSMRKLQELHFMVVIHYYLLTTTVISALFLIVVQRDFVVFMSATAWTAMLSAGVFGFFGQLFLTRGFQLEKAGIASVMRNLDLVFVFIWDFTLLHEHVSVWSIVGAIIICGCSILIAQRRMKQ